MAMASLPPAIFLISSILVLSTFSNAQIPSNNPKAFTFPIRKDVTTNQYYTTISIGSKITTLNVVIDLGGKFTWFHSADYLKAAAAYRPIKCESNECRLTNGGCIFCNTTPDPMPRCTNMSCSDYALNPFTGTMGFNSLGKDFLHPYSSSGAHYRINTFPFQFSDPVLKAGLAAPTVGLVALGRFKFSLQSQLKSAFKIREKFALCMPTSGGNGNMIIGDVAYRAPFQEISGAVTTTPLLKNPVSTWPSDQIGTLSLDYFIGVKSIRVGATALSLNKTLLSIDEKTGAGGTSIRTVRAYTSFHKSIYGALVKEFVKAAAAKKIKRVAAVAPFGACFDAKTIRSTKVGADVPTVDLVLQSEEVYWRLYGANTMVKVSEGVMCLAFVEGKASFTGGPTTSIVVGGYQLENYLVEFDVAESKLGFSSTLLLRHTTCSHFGAA